MKSPNTPGQDAADPSAPPSKTRRKQAMQELQDLGEALASLPRDRLKKADLPDNLREAVADYQRFTKFEAKRRQMQYIGRLIRDIDPEPLRAAVAAFEGASSAETARLHRLERLRERLLDDEATLTEIATAWPGADLQQLRQLRRNALKEKEAEKPPKAFREIFRQLKALDEGARSLPPPDEADAAEEAGS